MEAGQKLDVAVAVRVMGWKQAQEPTDPENWTNYPQEWFEDAHGYVANVLNIPRYSTDIAAAWLVVEEITKISRTARLENTRFATWFRQADLWAMSAGEATEAICLAALKAVDIEQPA